MSAIAEASFLLRRIAEPIPAGEHVKESIRRAASAVGWAHARTKSLWYGEAHRVHAEEMDRLRTLEAARRARNQRHQREEAKARDELLELRQRVSRLEQHLLQTDEDFSRPHCAALRSAVGAPDGAPGADHRALDRD